MRQIQQHYEWQRGEKLKDTTTVKYIKDLNNPSYRLLRPIPVVFRINSVGGVEAAFSKANIAACGFDDTDAMELLTEDIIAVFKLFTEDEARLDPGPRDELYVLRQYIERV